MKKLIIISVLTGIFLCSCQNNKKQSGKEEVSKEVSKEAPILDVKGRWEGKYNNDTGLYLSLHFVEQEDNKLSATYSTGGPFEVDFICEQEADELVLFLESIGGTPSFNKASGHDGSLPDKPKKVAICKLLDEQTIQLEFLEQIKDYCHEKGTYTLKKDE